MNTKLILLSSGTIEMYDDVPISLNYSIAEIQTIDKTNSAFSKTITVPGTKNNNKLLGHLFDIGVDNTYNVNTKAPCTIEVDTVQVMKGHMRIVNIRRVQDDKIEYDLEVSGETTTLFSAMSDSKVADLNLGSFLFLLSGITQTWLSNPENNAFDYAFPLFDHGQDSAHELYPYDKLRPMLKARFVLQKIFEFCGYTWDSDFLDSVFFKRLYVGGITDTWCLTKAELEERHFRASVGSMQTISSPVEHTKYDIQINDDTTSPNTDPSGLWNTSTYTFTAAHTGWFKFTGKIVVDFTSFTPVSNGYYVVVSAYYDYGGLFNYESDVGWAGVLTSAEREIPIEFNGFMSPGTTYKLRVRIHSNNTDTMPNIRIKTTSFIDHHSNPKLSLLGEVVQLNKAIDPDMTMREYVTSIIKAFNLFVEPDTTNSKRLRIEPRDDYYSSGTIVDWSGKLDRNRGIEIATTESQFKEYNFKYAKDTDEWNKRYTDTYGREYADRRVTMASDFFKEKKTSELVFAPTPCVQFMNSNRVVPAIYHNEKGVNKIKSTKMRLLYYAGMKASTPGFYLDYLVFDNSPTGTLYTEYPFFGMVDDPLNPTLSLDFGAPKELYWETNNYTNNNLYNRYYKKMMDENMSNASRLVTGYFYLTPADIAALDFRNTIHIDGINYRLNQVMDYNPVTPGLTKVELIKVVAKQTAEVLSPDVLGGGGDPISTPEPGASVNDTEIVPVRGQLNNVTNDGNVFYPDNGQFVTGRVNILSSRSTFATVSGERNSVGSDAKYIDMINSSGCIVGANCQNISLINSSGVIVRDGVSGICAINSGPRTISESNVAYVGDQIYKTSGVNSEFQIYAAKKSLTSAQIKTLNSVPVDFGISLPGIGYAIEIISASVRYNYNTTAFIGLFFLRLIADTAAFYQAESSIFNYVTNSFERFIITGNGGGVNVVENKKIYLQSDADTAFGDGDLDIYITYKIIQL